MTCADMRPRACSIVLTNDKGARVGDEAVKRSDVEASASVGLDEALAALRADLAAAQAEAAGSDLQFPVQSVTVELTVAVTKSVDGKAGFRVPVLGAELGTSGGREAASTQKLTVTLGPPVDAWGRPVTVTQVSSQAKG
jgi:Trypsin-co-occurring domain 2